MQCTRILSNGLGTCKERLNARLGSIPSVLSSRHSIEVTVLWTGEKASRGTGPYRPIIRNPDPVSLNRTYSSGRIVSPAPSATAWRVPSGEGISITTWVLICTSAHSTSTIFRRQ
jgi:hypothetical protein